MQEVKRDAKTNKLSAVGGPVPIVKKIVNAPKSPITHHFYGEDAIYLCNVSTVSPVLSPMAIADLFL